MISSPEPPYRAREPRDPARHRHRWTAAALAAAAVLAVTSPFWLPALLRPLAFFRVRSVEILGARYLTPNDVLSRLNVDTTASVWDDPAPLERRVARHPQVDSVEIGRKLPGTLVVRIVEKLPVALVPTAAGLRPVDGSGRTLPLDPTRVNVDLPIIAGRDVPILELLYTVRVQEPRLFDRISEVRRDAGALLIRLTDGITVRAPADVGVDRLRELEPVEQDLARRRARATELDLRYRDQVVARVGR